MKNMASAQDTKTQLDDLRGLFRKEMEKYFSRLNQVENELNTHKAAVKKVDEFTPLLKKLMEEFNTRLSNQRDHIESNSERINAQIEATNIFIREIEGNTKLNFTEVQQSLDAMNSQQEIWSNQLNSMEQGYSKMRTFLKR